jgi:phosphatidate cytidylyltransferase
MAGANAGSAASRPAADPDVAAQSGGPTSAPGPSRNLLLRIASAAVLAPFAVAVAYFGGWPFVLFWLLAAAAIWWEWLGLLGFQSNRALVLGGIAVLAAALVVTLIGPAPAGFLVLVFGAILAVVAAPRRREWAGAGIAYAGALLVATIGLRNDEAAGFLAIAFLFAVVWATDIFAYFVGRAVGGSKLAASISPNKTWSGAVGGLTAAVLAGLAVLRPTGLSGIVGAGLMILLLSAVSQAGDLFESRFKRLFEAKDAGSLIPGHGGVMDRLDGYIAAVVVAYVVGALRAGWDMPAQGLVRW